MDIYEVGIFKTGTAIGYHIILGAVWEDVYNVDSLPVFTAGCVIFWTFGY